MRTRLFHDFIRANKAIIDTNDSKSGKKKGKKRVTKQNYSQHPPALENFEQLGINESGGKIKKLIIIYHLLCYNKRDNIKSTCNTIV